MESSESHGLLSPPASAASPAASGTSYHNRTATLPTPRSHPLRPGSQKEIALINYLDDRILRISRRYAKKFSDEGLQNDDTPGYTTYDEFVADADPLVDVVWVSGTRKFCMTCFGKLEIVSPAFSECCLRRKENKIHVPQGPPSFPRGDDFRRICAH